MSSQFKTSLYLSNVPTANWTYSDYLQSVVDANPGVEKQKLNVFAIKNLTRFIESSNNPVKSNKVHELLESLCDQQCSTPQSSFSTDKQAANASSYNVNFTNSSSPFFGDGKPPATNTDVHISNNSQGMINYGDHVTYNDSRVVYEKEKGDRETGKRELQKANDNVAQKEVKRIKPNQVYTMLPNDIGSSSLGIYKLYNKGEEEEDCEEDCEEDYEKDYEEGCEEGYEEDYKEDYEEDYEDEYDEDEEPNLPSDLTEDHHPNRTGDYVLTEDSGETDENSEDIESVNNESSWVIKRIDLDVTKECILHKDNCLERSKPNELDDVSMLAMHSVYCFSEEIQSSITRHFGNPSHHHDILHDLDIYEQRKNPSGLSMIWCSSVINKSYTSFRDIQKVTIKILNEAIESRDDLDLAVANIIHRTLPLYKLTGMCNDIEEDTFVHNILAPLLDYTFSVDINLQSSWANVSMDSVYREYKPDYMIYANGLSKKFIVLVAEFKPPKAHQRFESDYIKLGKEMRLLINRLYELGVEKPVVCGILVLQNTIHTFKMELKDAKIYAMTQLSKSLLCKGSEDLYKVPTLVSALDQLKTLSLTTINKVQKTVKYIKDGDLIGPSVPSSFLDWSNVSLTRINTSTTKNKCSSKE